MPPRPFTSPKTVVTRLACSAGPISLSPTMSINRITCSCRSDRSNSGLKITATTRTAALIANAPHPITQGNHLNRVAREHSYDQACDAQRGQNDKDVRDRVVNLASANNFAGGS